MSEPAGTDEIFFGETDSLWNRLIERLEPEGIQVDYQPALPAMARADHLYLALLQ